MRAIRLAIAAAGLVAALNAVPAAATAYSTDQSDLWWIPAEGGWGIQLVQRGPLIFATMFVYAANGTPTWYVALLQPPGAASDVAAKAATLSWSGDLDTTTGTGFAAVWNPAAFHVTKVGTMTWTPTDANSGTLVYSVNGATVSKNIVREFIALDDFSGTFVGAIHQTTSGCTNAADNGTLEDFATLATTQQGTSFGFTLTSQLGLACTFAGALGQAGQFGSATGTAVCNSQAQPVTLSTMVVGVNSLALQYDAQGDAGCATSGYFSGARHR